MENPKGWVGMLYIVVQVIGCSSASSATERVQEAKKALEYVSQIEESKGCSGGTENVLTLSFNHTAWTTLTDPAIRTANYLSKLLAMDNNTLNRLDDGMFYSFVRNNVHGDTLIFGSAIALEPGLYDKYEKFCPYAYKQNSSVSAFDIAVNYDYLLTSTEWYNAVKIKDFANATLKQDRITYNFSDVSQVNVPFLQPIAAYPDGRWTWPYYDCGGGNIWMVTYSSPILSISPSGVPTFQGVATIDIELTNIDINQCDVTNDGTSGALDVFRGTHNCQPTTRCVALIGRGFNRGSYHCVCEDGYYFPDREAEIKAYIGTDIEGYIDATNATDMTSRYSCLPCPRGCDTCTDSTPCLFQSNPIVRALIILVIIIMILGCCCISFVVFRYKNEMVIKTASPIFLHLMCLGAILMCCHAFFLYPESTDKLCIIEIWPFHLGFALMYGALIVKTWRISVIFSVGSIKRVNLPDKSLLQRLLPVVLFMVLYLSCWTGISPPAVVTLTASNKLKFFACSNTLWTFAIYGVEALLLLFGVYLCFTVRKAPAHFNESKHITWSTYNAIILGSFTLILTQLLAVSSGPDVLYVLRTGFLQALVTITMALIFAPKFWALFKHSEWTANNGNATITGRLKPIPTMTTHVPPGVRHMGIQTDVIYLTPNWTKDTAHSSQKTPSRPGSRNSAKVAPLEIPHNSPTGFLSG